jgi:hypothetical protein
MDMTSLPIQAFKDLPLSFDNQILKDKNCDRFKPTPAVKNTKLKAKSQGLVAKSCFFTLLLLHSHPPSSGRSRAFLRL